MINNNTIDPKFFNFVSQVAHCSTTYAISLTFYARWGFYGWIFAAVTILAYAAVHEFWYDVHYENPATRGSDLEDFIFLVLGPVLALLIGHFGLRFN